MIPTMEGDTSPCAEKEASKSHSDSVRPERPPTTASRIAQPPEWPLRLQVSCIEEVGALLIGTLQFGHLKMQYPAWRPGLCWSTFVVGHWATRPLIHACFMLRRGVHNTKLQLVHGTRGVCPSSSLAAGWREMSGSPRMRHPATATRMG